MTNDAQVVSSRSRIYTFHRWPRSHVYVYGCPYARAATIAPSLAARAHLRCLGRRPHLFSTFPRALILNFAPDENWSDHFARPTKILGNNHNCEKPGQLNLPYNSTIADKRQWLIRIFVGRDPTQDSAEIVQSLCWDHIPHVLIHVQ